MKTYTNELGHITNMGVLPKFSNYDPGLTLTHFTPRSNLVT